MRTSKSRQLRMALAVGLSLLVLVVAPSRQPLQAGGPLRVLSDETLVKWFTFPIMYNTDGGPLGTLTNEEANALVAAAFGEWAGVATSTVAAAQESTGMLTADGDVNTVAEYNALGCEGVNPMVYDDDGTIIDGVFGAGASDSILGFAGPCAFNSVTGEIVGGEMVLNGKGDDGSASFASRLRGTAVHELGHLLGLEHSVINFNCTTDPLTTCADGSDDIFGVPTMYPTSLLTGEVAGEDFANTLATDDIAWISFLYPTAGFAGSTGSVEGTAFFGNGVDGVQGGNVIARRVDDPATAGIDESRRIAVSNVSGWLAKADHGNTSLGLVANPFGTSAPARRGYYRIPGLPVASPTDYTVSIESIVDPSFVGGSSVGPVGDQRGEHIPLPGAAGNIPITVDAGTALTGQDFVLDDTLDRSDDFEPNNTIGTATEIGNGTFEASISPFASTDPDVYKFNATSGNDITIEIFARRLLVPDDIETASFLDSVIEIVNSSGVRQTTCDTETVAMDGTISPPDGVFDNPCLNDDQNTATPATRDSKLVFRAPSTGAFFVIVSDAFGDARPDFQYRMTVSGADAASADLVITKTDSADPVLVGDQITYTITGTNNGPAVATNVMVTDTFTGAAVTIDSVTTDDGTCTAPVGGSFTCDLGTGPSGGSATIIVVVTANEAGTITNTVSATADENDPNTDNNTAIQTTTVTAAGGCTKNFDNGAGTGLYQDAANWDPDGVPTATDTACIGDAFAVTLSAGDHEVNTLLVTSTAVFTISGGSLTINSVGSSSIGAGGFTQSGGSLLGPGTMNVNGAFNWTGGTQGGTGVTNSNGGVTMSGAGTKTLARTLNNSTSASLTAGTLSIAASGTLSTTATLNIEGGVLEAASGTTITGNVNQTGGTISPGLSPGILNLDGNVNQDAGGTVQIELAGTTVGTQYDQINVTGTAVVNGTFNVVLIDGFTPVEGDTFTIATAAGGGSGDGPINLPALPPGLDWEEVDDPNALIIRVVAVAGSADLAVTKTDSPDPVDAGGTITYTITVTNNGPDDATGVTVTDTLPAGTTFVSSVPGGPTCTHDAGVVTCNVGGLANAASTVITITVTAPAEGGVITNTVEVESNQVDPDTNNNTASEETTVNPVADLEVTKTDSPDPVIVGATLTYTVTVTNNGPSTATGVTLTDTLPAGTTFVSATPGSPTCTHAAGVVTCDLDSLAPGANTVVTIEVTAPDTEGVITNTVTVAGNEDDPDAANNTATEDTSVTPAADLEVVKTDSPDPVDAGATLTYTITVTNNGPSDATGVTLVDTLPAGTTFVSASAGCAHAAGVVTCDIGALAVDASAVVTIEVTAPVDGGVITNTAEVSGDQGDPDTDNNTATEDTTVTAQVDLTVTKTDSPDPVFAGGTLTYTITVSNNGPSRADNVVLTDTLPAGTAFVSATPGAPTCTHAAGVVTCNLGNVADGGSAVVTIVVTAPAEGGTILNTVSVTADGDELVPADNTDTESTEVIALADLAVTKSDDPDPVFAGNNVTYTIVVTNLGPSTAGDVTLTDPLPATTTFVSLVSPAGWTCTTPAVGANGVVTCSIASLPPGMGTFTLVVETSTPGVISNTVTVVSSDVIEAAAALDAQTTADPDLDNNSDTETTTVVEPEFELSSPTPPQTIRAGQAAQFRIVVSPLGNFIGTVTFSTTGEPPRSTVTFNPASLSIEGEEEETVLTITTVPRVRAEFGPPGSPPVAPLLALWALALLLSGAALWLRKKRMVWRPATALSLVLLLAALGAVALGNVSCAGGFPLEEARPETFDVTVTGTSGALQRSTTVTLTVQ